MLVSVSAAADGSPIQNLKPKHFLVHHLASFNHAGNEPRTVIKADEGPPGFYILSLELNKTQTNLPSGHYVFAVAVTSTSKRAIVGRGQTVAVGDMP